MLYLQKILNFIACEDTFIHMKKSLNCKGKLLDLSTPVIMGILNITPDSFYDGGQITGVDSALRLAESMLIEGALILDIGGQSTRPGAKSINSTEEWKRIGPSLISIKKHFPDAIISIDTFHSDVAKNAVEEGASIINDISAGDFDKGMFSFVLQSQVPYILMHMKGSPENMQENPQYENVVSEVLNYFINKVSHLKMMGLNDIIIDPGFGFGKTIENNFSLLKNLSLFQILDCPILAGVSRKSMITKTLNITPPEALNGTTALNTIALLNGASILRVHDVAEAMEANKLVIAYQKSK